MKEFLNKLITLGLFILAAGLFYISATASLPTIFLNIVCIIVAIFVLLQACGNIDKLNGFGKYSASTNSDSSKENQKSSRANNNQEEKQDNNQYPKPGDDA